MTGVESVDIVDIDSRVFEIAEREFLREPLHSKITPIAQSARGWAYDAIQRGERYDMIWWNYPTFKGKPCLLLRILVNLKQ